MTPRRTYSIPAALCAALLCPLALPCPSAGASEPSARDAAPTDEAKSRAQELLAKGIEAFRAQRFKRAIDSFLAAHALYPSAAISFNLARAYEGLKDAPAALRFYRDYLRRSPNAADTARIAQRIEGLEDQLRARGVQQVSIYSIPTGATLLVDERAVGLTPWTGELAPGTHQLRLEQEGHLPQQETFELAPHRALELELTLAAEPPPAPPPAATPAASAPTPAFRPSTRPADAAPSPTGGSSVLPWIALGAAGVTLGGAVYFELASAGAEDDARHARSQTEAMDRIESMHGRQTTARVLLGAGAALAVTGGVLFLLSGGKPSGPVALSLSCGRLGCDLRGQF
ncbi:MAG: hypothetical protein RL033_6943 [Pseudomonadota bacterium]